MNVSMLGSGQHLSSLSKFLAVTPHVFLHDFGSASNSVLEAIVTHCEALNKLTVAPSTWNILVERVSPTRGHQIQSLRLPNRWIY